MSKQDAFGFHAAEDAQYYDDGTDGAKTLAQVIGDVLCIDTTTARRLVVAFDGDLALMSKASLVELAAVKGIGHRRAIQIRAAIEFGRRWFARHSADPAHSKAFTCAEDVAAFYWPRFAGKQKEEFHALLLSTKGKIIKDVCVSVGQLDGAMVHPREVFNPAIRHNAHSIIVSHNHPSGDPRPSVADEVITKKLVEAGETVGITVLDHVVVGAGGSFYSMKQEGRM